MDLKGLKEEGAARVKELGQWVYNLVHHWLAQSWAPVVLPLRIIYALLLAITVVSLLLSFSRIVSFQGAKGSLRVYKRYDFDQSPEQRLLALSILTEVAKRVDSPLWSSLRPHIHLIKVNARPDAEQGQEFFLRILDQEEKIVLGQRLYFAQDSGRWRQVTSDHAITLVFYSWQEEQQCLHGRLMQPDIDDTEVVLEVEERVADAKKSSTAFSGLMRMGLRWLGEDLFLKDHTGAGELPIRLEWGNKERRQVGYLTSSDGIIADAEGYRVAPLGAQTRDRVLWVCKLVDPKTIEVVAWGEQGQSQQRIILKEHKEMWNPQKLLEEVKFVGVQSHQLLVFELQGRRTLLSPGDWLLRYEDGWKRISEVTQLDQYVSGMIEGELLILDRVVKHVGSWRVEATLYSAKRSMKISVTLPLGDAPSSKVPLLGVDQEPFMLQGLSSAYIPQTSD